ncbi:AsmA family protein [Shewanella sp. AS1]|uniref:AsmA family protein n=1 Tax=Shewanella sp. AS1 TaxID=2907626 RepID=UPI001F2C2CD0|nr:AsmA family protein [Shewanella sp. AS1]MCE9678816.1 AsmA family protein [Shewanella sp. AS1]
MKFIKWLSIVVVSLFVLLFAYLTLIFDLNDFKPQIVDLVKQQTGRELAIEQDLSWTFFPAIGIKLGDISLTNPQGFKHPEMLSVKGIVAEVALMPLLSREIEIAQLNLDGLTLNLDSYKDGRSSFDGLSGDKAVAAKDTKTDEKSPATTAPQAPSQIELGKLTIGGVAITNTQINLFDEASNQTQTFNLDELKLGAFSLDEFASFSYQFSASMPDMQLSSEGEGLLKVAKSLDLITIKDFIIKNRVEGAGIPNQSLSNHLELGVQIDSKAKQLSVMIAKLTANEIQGTGKLDVDYGSSVPEIVADLDFGDINLDNWLPKGEDSKSADTSKQATDKQQAAQQEPDLSGLKLVNATLDIKVKSISTQNIKTQNWVLAMVLKNGVLDLKRLSSDLYQGKMLTRATLDGRNKVASYKFVTKVEGIQIRPLLTDAAEVDLLAGKTQFNVTGSGKSLIPDNIKSNLLANGNFEVADGALYGVNIPQMLRDAKAKLSGNLNAPTSAEKKTDFTSLTGSFSMAKGVVSNPDLSMASPLIRLAGKGQVNLISEAIDYKLSTSVVGSLEGQGGSERDSLYGVEIPFAISGSMAEPKFALDTKALFDNKLKQETEKAKDKLKDKLFKKLGGF